MVPWEQWAGIRLRPPLAPALALLSGQGWGPQGQGPPLRGCRVWPPAPGTSEGSCVCEGWEKAGQEETPTSLKDEGQSSCSPRLSCHVWGCLLQAFANPEDALRNGGLQFCRPDPDVERCRRWVLWGWHCLCHGAIPGSCRGKLKGSFMREGMAGAVLWDPAHLSRLIFNGSMVPGQG